jgi:spermidine synthase
VRVLLGVGLVAGSTLALQVLLTRVFSNVLLYHFGFLTISLALLGVGAAAITVYVRPHWFDRIALERQLARWSLAFGALLAIAIFVIVRLDYVYTGIDTGFALTLAAASTLAALPFIAAGLVIALAVRGYARSIGTLYAFDLAGAGIGAVAVVPLLWLVPAPTLVVVVAALGAVAAFLFAGATPERTWALGGGGLAIVLVVLAAATGVYDLKPPGVTPAADRWTPISRVIGYGPLGGSRSGFVTYDRVIGEVVPYHRGDPLPDWRKTQEGPQSVGYRLTGPGRTLIIGGGGGRDIVTALSERQRVDVIELNRAIRDVVDDDLRFVSGAPYTLPGVSTAIGDGRSTLTQRDDRYDTVHLGFTDTYSGNSAQAFALTENNLYTVEAFQEYLDHLKPGGVLNVSRPDREGINEALRATVLAMEALKREGVSDPRRHVVVLLGTYSSPFNTFRYGTVLAKKEPFTAVQLAGVKRLAAQRSEGVAFAPGGPYAAGWNELAAAPDHRAFCEHAAFDYCAPTDDRPFFFNLQRVGHFGETAAPGGFRVPDPTLILAITLGILLVLSALAFALPLALVRGEGRPSVGSLTFFAAIGLGFLVLEVVLIQRFVLFLGFPTYALSVVLFALLIFTGIGSLVSVRLAKPDPRRVLVAALGLGAAMIALAAVGLQPLLRALIDLPFAARIALTIAMLAPLGAVLGMAMPIGLRRLEGLYPSGVAWAWGINGIASVLASVLAITVAIMFGFTAATLLALACYLVALGHALWARWPAGEADAGGRAPAREPAGVA